jgi:hypothetical protein
MTESWSQIVARVELRSGGRCEYCRMHQSLQGATFHLEHIHPESRGGGTDLDNLAWSCPSCNLHKSNRIEATDPQTNTPTPLFHPRHHAWSQHFQWQGHVLIGKTPTGRATIAALQLNLSRRLLIRQAEERFGLFPPP